MEFLYIAIDDALPLKDEATLPGEGESDKLVPRKWLEIEEIFPSHQVAKANGDLTLECAAVGSPPPTIYWMKNGKPIENVSWIFFSSYDDTISSE
jgi:hypothetical protein